MKPQPGFFRLIGRTASGLGLLGILGLGPGNPAAQAQESTYRRVPRATIETRLKAAKSGNDQRKKQLERLFEEAGCARPDLAEQRVPGARTPNVICRLAGTGEEIILVGAHYDHVPEGEGVVDNWSGASLLPSLFESLSTEPRRHSFLFVGFTDEEKGLVGSSYYAAHLTAEERARLQAVVNLDTLGLSPTKVWQSHADAHLLRMLARASGYLQLPVSGMDVDSVGTADSESFARFDIPRITLHSATQETLPILHSPQDNLQAIRMDDYYRSYRLLAGFLAFLDGCAQLQFCPDTHLPDFPQNGEALYPPAYKKPH